MKGFYFVCVQLWLLPLGLGLNAAVTPQQSNNFTDIRTGEVTADEVSSTSLDLALQHHTTVQHTHSQLSTRNTVDSTSFSTDLSLRTKTALKLTLPKHGQTTQHKSSVNITTEKMEGISPTLGTKASGGHVSPPSMGELSTTETTTSNIKSGPLEVLAQTTHSKTSLPNQSADILTGQTPAIAVQSQSNSSKEMHSTSVQFKVTHSLTTAVMAQVKSFSTEATSKPPLTSIPSQGAVTEMTLPPLTPTDKHLSSPSEKLFIATSTTIFSLSTGVTKPTTRFSTEGTYAKPAENNSTTAGTVTAGDKVVDSTQSSGGTQSTPMAPTKKSITTTTKAKKKTKPTLSKPDNRTQGESHGTVVAVVIGGALVVMMIGFLVIYVKKRNLQKQQMSSRDWAGPSPFLDGGVDNNGPVELRASNRISLAGFLPQRLSKRLSLLQETDEELGEMAPSSTFGDHNPTSTFGREVVGEEVKASNGTATVIQEETQMQEDPELVRPSPVTSSESNVPLSTDDSATEPPAAHSEDVDLVQDCPGTNLPPSDAEEDIPPPQLDDDQGKTSDEPSPPSSESADNLIPPAPPLAVSMQQQQQQQQP